MEKFLSIFDFFIMKSFILSFIASLGFAILLSVPKVDLVISSIIGGVGWVLYIILKNITGEIIIPYFFATITIGILGNICSKKTKKPALVYIIPGIIPLVPGYSMYYTTFHLVSNNYALAFEKGLEALSIAFAISSGLIISESLRKITNNFMDSLEKKSEQISDISSKIFK